MTGFGWYVVQSHPNKESFVRQRVLDLDREVFLPLLTERVPGRRRMKTGPLFPGYLFARLSHDAGDFPRVRWSPGVRGLLGEGRDPRPLDDTVIRCIRERTDRSGRLRVGRKLRPGARVRIVEGPLAGLIGILERPVHSAEARVLVLLEVFHRPTPVELPVHAVWCEAAS